MVRTVPLSVVQASLAGVIPMAIDPQLLRLVDHIEVAHEREVAPGTSAVEVARMHVDMHRNSNHWDHRHDRKGNTIWGEMDA